MAISQFDPQPRSRAEVDEYDAAEARAQDARRLEAFGRFGIPKRIRKLIPDGVTDTGFVERVVRWHSEQQADESGWCLVLSAQPGTGKSTAAGVWLWLRTAGVVTSIGGEPVTRPDLGAKTNAQRWFSASEIAAASGFDGSVDSLCSVRALVIDDLGTEYADRHGFVKTRLDVIVDARYREFRPTVITTNLNLDAFKKRFGERVTDRLREGGSWCELPIESLRGRK